MVYFRHPLINFGHANIIKPEYCDRPFANVEEMDRELIKNWNSVVGPDDTVYHLGDFCFGSSKDAVTYRFCLNGTIHLIRGNHEKAALNAQKNYGTAMFESVRDYAMLDIKPYPSIVLFHYPIHTWDRKHHGAWHVFGHVHNNPCNAEDNGLCMNVGVDVCAFTPVSIEQVKEFMTR